MLVAMCEDQNNKCIHKRLVEEIKRKTKIEFTEQYCATEQRFFFFIYSKICNFVCAYDPFQLNTIENANKKIANKQREKN